MNKGVIVVIVLASLCAAAVMDPDAAAGAMVFALLALCFAFPAVVIVGPLVDFFRGKS